MPKTAPQIRIFQAIDALDERIASQWGEGAPGDVPSVVYGHAVMLRAWKHADAKTGEFFPKIETIAAKCHTSPRTVIKVLAELKRLGIIKQKSRGGNGRGSSVWVILEKYRIFGRSRVQDVHVTQSRVQDVHTSRVQDVHTNSTSTKQTNSSCAESAKSDSPLHDNQPKKKTYKYDDGDVKLVKGLADVIRDGYNQSFAFSGNIETHHNDMRKLREYGSSDVKEAVSIERIIKVGEWLRSGDTFWVRNGNIRSVATFRAQFHRLEAASRGESAAKGDRPTIDELLTER